MFWLLVAIACWVLTYVAIHRVIVKAGFSGLWVLLPIVPVVVWIVGLVVLRTTRLDLFQALRDYLVLIGSIIILAIANWVGFLVFAFREWPALAPGGRLRGTATGSGARIGPGGSPFAVPGGVAPNPGASAAFGASALQIAVAPPVSAATPAAATHDAMAATVPASATPSTFYCSWCGKARTPNALAIHHCGSRDRPAVFCSGCGRGLEQAVPFCAACGTAAAQLSPP